MTPRRFRVALSFAGEKRSYAEQVAALLIARLGHERVVSDETPAHGHTLSELGDYFLRLYTEQTDLVVPILHPSSDGKHWTAWEWLKILGLLTKMDASRIMLARFESANAEELGPASSVIELDQKSPEDLVALILERLKLNDAAAKDGGPAAAIPPPPPPANPIPNNLPRLLPFFGREAELAQIRTALDPATGSWGILIAGPGGIGKTSLAVRAAHLADPARFDRIIFISVEDREREHDGGLRPDARLHPAFLQILHDLARALDVFRFNESAEANRPPLVLNALRPLKVLLILDRLDSFDKEAGDQLSAFLKRLFMDCKAILTSRHPIGSGGALLTLGKLSEDAALATLAELAEANQLLAKTSKAERIVLHTQTGGNPLLLRWTAGQLGRGSCRTFTDAIASLRSCPKDNDPLEFVFGDLAREFTDAETKVLASLTYFSQPATVEHIAAVAGADLSRRRGDESLTNPEKGPTLPTPPSTEDTQRLLTSSPTEGVFDLAAVETALRTLANRSLVVPDQEEKAYALVPMVADFMRNRCPEVVAATGRHLEQRAYSLIMERGRHKLDRFPNLDAAWPTVAPAIPLFVAGPNERLQAVAGALWMFFFCTGRLDEWLSLAGQAEVKAIASGDWLHAGKRAQDAGRISLGRKDGDAVLACARRMAAHYAAAQAGPRERAAACLMRSYGLETKQDAPAALTAARESLEILRTESTESERVVQFMNVVGDFECSTSDYPAAERDLHEALRIARKLNFEEGVVTSLSNLAWVALSREDGPGAEALAREALRLAEQAGFKDLIHSCSLWLSCALAKQDKQAESKVHFDKGFDLMVMVGPQDCPAVRAAIREAQP